MIRNGIAIAVLSLMVLAPVGHVLAWSEHPLISFPALASIPKVRDAAPVRAEMLDTFVRAEKTQIEQFLLKEEAWARKNIPSYAQLPEALAFKSEGNQDGITKRFCGAIRINSDAGFPLYLQLIPGQTTYGRPSLSASKITFFRDTSGWNGTTFVAMRAGESVKPLDVVVSATDEPDLLGLDIGLFEDNETAFGKVCGFGRQPFGNPHLEYGTQAPFHMGFYHESRIMYVLAGFLRRTYPEYRIHLYAGLSELAFRNGHPYWGWRFMGWGLHYLADLTQPYHATVLPGIGTAQALWINTMDMIGFHGAKSDAIQLVSNRHTALEKYQQVVLRKAYQENEQNNPILTGLRSIRQTAPYDSSIPRQAITKLAHAKAGETDRLLDEAMPRRFVSDPNFELGTSNEKEQIVERMVAEKGKAGAEKLTLVIRDLLAPFAVYAPGYVNAILK
jgi:hypothetical protein